VYKHINYYSCLRPFPHIFHSEWWLKCKGLQTSGNKYSLKVSTVSTMDRSVFCNMSMQYSPKSTHCLLKNKTTVNFYKLALKCWVSEIAFFGPIGTSSEANIIKGDFSRGTFKIKSKGLKITPYLLSVRRSYGICCSFSVFREVLLTWFYVCSIWLVLYSLLLSVFCDVLMAKSVTWVMF
jgi:hypothetical protein